MRNILAIDNKKENLETIEAVIKKNFQNCEYLTALSAKEGLAIAKKVVPDTILLSIHLPEMDALKVCEKLKEYKFTKHVPVLLIRNSKTDSEISARGIAAGANAFLTLPVDEIDWVAQINLALRLNKAEDSVRQSQEKYKSLYDNAPMSYQSLNDDGSFLDVNPTWLSTLGYNREEVIGKFYKDFLHPDWKPHFEKNFPAFKKRGYVNDVQFRIRHKKGHYIDISFEGCVGYNLDGTFKQTYCVFKDITFQKQAEDKLLENQYYLKKTQELGKIGTWELDIVQNKLVWTKETYNIFGVLFDTPINYELFLEIVHPEDRAIVNEKWTKAINNEPYEVEHRLLVDNKVKWVRQKAELNFDSEGNAIGAIGFCQDITASKQIEEQISAAEKNLKNTFDISPSIICKANLNTGYFIEANEAVTRILGYSVEEFTSKPLFEFIHPDDRQKTIDEIERQQKGNKTTFFENRYLCKDGSYRWMAWHASKAGENGIVTAIASDINERKIIEKEISATKQFYESIIEGVQDGIWVTDKSDVIFYANSAMEKIAGKPREKIQGNNVLTDFPEETTGELIKYYNQAKRDKKPIWYLIKVVTPTHRNTWQNGWLIPQYQNKEFDGMICTIRDVTERKLAESSVRRLSTAVQQSPSVIVITDTEAKLEYINPKFTELTGYSSAEAIGQKANILKSGLQDRAFYEEMWKTVHAGKVWRGQFHNKKKNGDLFWEMASISAILNESGEVTNYIKIGEDITEVKLAEMKLRQSTQLLEASQAISKVGGWELDIATKQLFWTDETYRIYDTSPEEFNPTVDAGVSYFLPESRRIISEALKAAVEQGEGYDLILETYTTKGRKIDVRTTCEVTFLEGRPAKLTGIFQDITQQKQIEQELIIAKEKAEESGRLKSAFLANMSHEIRTPMNGIIGFLDLMADKNVSSKQQKNYIRLVNRSGERLLATINDIIEISRIESGEIPMVAENVNIYEILTYLLDIFAPEAKTKGLMLELEMDEQDDLITIKSDSNKLEAVLTNLIKNALKFTAKGSVRFGYKINNEKIIFFVKDTGIGIAADRVDAIFERFVQANLSLSRGHEGSGLGLAISKAYVKMLGGNLWVDSELGKGSTFYFEFQHNMATILDEAAVDNVGQLNLSTITDEVEILVVEDDLMSLELIQAIFADKKVKLIDAKDGKEALDKFKSNPNISLIIMDLKMPKMNGFEATKQIRLVNATIPIIAQTAFALDGDKEKALAAGCSDYITKPLNKTDLISKINLYLKVETRQ
jgi:PAS domain S-box-containing protein